MSRRSLRSGTPSLRLREARAAEAAEDSQSQRGRKRTRTPSPRRSASQSVPTTAARVLLTLGKQRATPNTGGDTATSRPPTTKGAKDTPSFGRVTEAQRLELLQSAFRPRSPQVISEDEEGFPEGSPTQSEEEEEVVESAIPPSAQTGHSNTSKRRKSDKTERRRVSPSPESDTSAESTYSLSKVSFRFTVHVFMGKDKAFSIPATSQTYDHSQMLYDCRGRLLGSFSPGAKKTVDRPAFGGDFVIIAQRMKKPYTLTINSQEDFEMACRSWWEISHKPKRLEHEITAQLTLKYKLRVITPSPTLSDKDSSDSDEATSTRPRHEDSTQGRRRKDKERRKSKSKKSKTSAPSATQRQREERQQRAEIIDQVGKEQMLLSQRYKCQRYRVGSQVALLRSQLPWTISVTIPPLGYRLFSIATQHFH